MKRLFITLFTLISLQATAAPYEQGTHYQLLSTPLKTKAPLVEFFSFYCPACYRQEAIFSQLEKELANNVAIEKNHVDGMPGRNKDIEYALTKALITAKQLKIKDKIVGDIFKYIHVNRADFKTVKDIKNLFLLRGVEATQLDKIFNSFSVSGLANKMRKNTSAIRAQGYGAVPTLIVHGKYKLETKHIKSYEQYKALVEYLLAKEN